MAAELSVEALRAEIDQIDEVIVRLLDSRARCAYAIGRVKRNEGKPVYEPAREASVLAHVRTVNRALDGPLEDEAIVRLFERVIDEARRIQRLEATRSDEAGDGAVAAVTGQGE